MNPVPAPPPSDTPPRDAVILISGISGSGKSVALSALEDAGYFCVDNLPPELLREFIWLEHRQFTRRVAVAVDVRTAASLPLVLPLLDQLRAEGVPIHSLFFDAGTETLLRRFSETRRRHPLAEEQSGGVVSRSRLVESILRERQMLADLREASTLIDTSDLRPAQLRAWVRQLAGAATSSLTLVFESFAYKHGVPRDADVVFDLRVLPNPHYVRELRPFSGRDKCIVDYLQAQPEVHEMMGFIESYLARWLPAFDQDQRSYLTVALGCTGGQHRSVYFAEELGRRLAGRVPMLVRHRELQAQEEEVNPV